jgi:hypothetical protein
MKSNVRFFSFPLIILLLTVLVMADTIYLQSFLKLKPYMRFSPKLSQNVLTTVQKNSKYGNQYVFVRLFIMVILEFELMTLQLLGRHSTT